VEEKEREGEGRPLFVSVGSFLCILCSWEGGNMEGHASKTAPPPPLPPKRKSSIAPPVEFPISPPSQDLPAAPTSASGESYSSDDLGKNKIKTTTSGTTPTTPAGKETSRIEEIDLLPRVRQWKKSVRLDTIKMEKELAPDNEPPLKGGIELLPLLLSLTLSFLCVAFFFFFSSGFWLGKQTTPSLFERICQTTQHICQHGCTRVEERNLASLFHFGRLPRSGL
jgi:hypothetical protein